MVFRHREYRPEDDVRETPASFFDPLHAKNGYTIDACAIAPNTKCSLFYSVDGLRLLRRPGESELLQAGCDGLTGIYTAQRVWANVPFSMFHEWLPWAWKNSDAELITMLAPGTRQDRPWWQTWVEPYRDKSSSGSADWGRAQPPCCEDPTWRLRTTYCAGRVDFLEDGHPIYQKDRKTGEVFLYKSGKHKGLPKESTAMFGCVLLEWRHE